MSAAVLLLAGGLALAEPPPVVVVRPLPLRERPALRPGYTKTELIAAAWVDRTVSYTPLGAIEAADGPLLATPAAFSCTVQGNQLTVSYTREGFDTEGLPATGTCGEGDGAFAFRIRVEK